MPTSNVQSLSKSYTVFTQHCEFYSGNWILFSGCSGISNCHCRVLIVYQNEKESDFIFFFLTAKLQEKDLKITWKKCFNPCWEHIRCCYTLLPNCLLLFLEYLSLSHIHKYFWSFFWLVDWFFVFFWVFIAFCLCLLWGVLFVCFDLFWCFFTIITNCFSISSINFPLFEGYILLINLFVESCIFQIEREYSFYSLFQWGALDEPDLIWMVYQLSNQYESALV